MCFNTAFTATLHTVFSNTKHLNDDYITLMRFFKIAAIAKREMLTIWSS